jgi:hypothetical protein
MVEAVGIPGRSARGGHPGSGRRTDVRRTVPIGHYGRSLRFGFAGRTPTGRLAARLVRCFSPPPYEPQGSGKLDVLTPKPTLPAPSGGRRRCLGGECAYGCRHITCTPGCEFSTQRGRGTDSEDRPRSRSVNFLPMPLGPCRPGADAGSCLGMARSAARHDRSLREVHSPARDQSCGIVHPVQEWRCYGIGQATCSPRCRQRLMVDDG